jgi:diguanylate cyclase (GGDEF)-like protein
VLTLAGVGAPLTSGAPWTSTLSSALLGASVVLAALAIADKLPLRVRRRIKHLSALGGATALLAVWLGKGSAATLATLGLAVWGLAATFGPTIGIGAAAVTIVVAATAASRGGANLANALGAATLTGSLALLPYWYGRRLTRAQLRRARRVTRVDAHISRSTPSRPVAATPAAFSKDALLSVERIEATQDLEMLEAVLRDVRDMTHADEAIFWRWVEERDTIVPTAWSTESADRPQFFRVDEWSSLARWSAQERLVTFEGSDDAPLLAAAPVTSPRDEQLHGVITVSSNIGLGFGKEAAKEWLPRFAAQIATYHELFDLKSQYGQHMRRNQALLDAMQRLQMHKSAEALGNAVCETALEVSSGRSALLIRWLPQDGYGLVQYASRELALEPGTIIGRDTLVGRTCRDGLPLVLEDARTTTIAEPPYTASMATRAIPSLAVIPVTRDQRVIGAIVVEGDEPGSITFEESRTIGLLAAVARGSLEIVWEIEEASQRARTDALTGLANRRHFDEQLKRVLAETDRFGGSSSLMLIDLDNFKRVNDTFGHEAGDAVLKQVARTLADGVRAVDICARFGGEEFVILLPQTPTGGATELAERLRKSIEDRPVSHEGASMTVTASIGIAGYPETVPYGDWLFPAADKALYTAKNAGRNCVKTLGATNEMPTNYKSNK